MQDYTYNNHNSSDGNLDVDQTYPSSSSLLQHDEFGFAVGGHSLSHGHPQSHTATRNANVTTVATPAAGDNGVSISSSSSSTNYVQNFGAAANNHDGGSNSNFDYPIVEVVAPASLRAGYTFDVEVNHDIFTVTVVRFHSNDFFGICKYPKHFNKCIRYLTDV